MSLEIIGKMTSAILAFWWVPRIPVPLRGRTHNEGMQCNLEWGSGNVLQIYSALRELKCATLCHGYNGSWIQFYMCCNIQKNNFQLYVISNGNRTKSQYFKLNFSDQCW